MPVEPLAEILGALRFSSVVYCRVTAAPPWGVAIPAGPAAGFHMIRAGAYTLEAAGHTVRPSQGDVVLLPRGPEQRIVNHPNTEAVPLAALMSHLDAGGSRAITIGDAAARDDCTELMCAAFFFDRQIWDPVFAFLPDIVHLRREDYADTLLPTMLEAVAHELSSAGPASEVVRARLGDVIFVETLRTALRTGAIVGDGPSWMLALRDPPMARALQQMVCRPQRRWSIDELADAVGVSRSAFTARFRKAVGTSPLQYLTQWRMIKAAGYLEDTDWSVSRVAEEVGYGSEVSFAKAFKAAVGIPPGRYRTEAASRRTMPA